MHCLQNEAYQDIANQGKCHGYSDMVSALVLVRCVERDCQRHEEGKEIGWGSKQQSLGRVKAQSANDRGEEIVERLRCDEGHLHDDKHVQLGVLQSLLQPPPYGLDVFVDDTGILSTDAPFLELFVSGCLGQLAETSTHGNQLQVSGDKYVLALEWVIRQQRQKQNGDHDCH